MKIYTNLYKKLLLLFLTVFISYDIRVEEEVPEEPVQEEVEEVEDFDPFEEASRGMNHKDIAQFNAALIKQAVHQITGGNLENNLTSLEESLVALTVIVNNLSIVAQLGLINTSAASCALTTTLVISNSNVDAYNNDITAALLAVATAVSSPSITNTTTAQALLSTAINNFNIIISNYYGRKSVDSIYSFAEINSALAQLNAQLGYLYILQGP